MKRFTETTIWEQDWYLELPLKYMKFWDYVKDKCNHAGVFKPEKKIFEIIIRDKIDLPEAIKMFNNGKERVVVLKNGRWLLPHFISFQQGSKLNLNNSFHRSIHKQLLDDGVSVKQVRGLAEVSERSKRPLSTSNSNSTKKEKNKDIYTNEQLEAFWTLYPKRHGVKVGKSKTFDRIKAVVKVKDYDNLMVAVKHYVESKLVKDGYARDAERFIKNDYWVDWIEKPIEESEEDDTKLEIPKNAQF